MIVYSTHQKIDALRKIVPNSFVFVLDTTDRSFIYKSKIDPDCERFVVSLDETEGIDFLTKDKNSHTFMDENRILRLEKIGGNTFLGICAPKTSLSVNKLDIAESYMRN